MIPLFKVTMNVEGALDNLNAVLSSGYIGQGPWVDRFERAIAEFLSTPERIVEPWQVVTVNSGTSAIQLALVVHGVRFEDMVICTPLTCAADWHTIENLGAGVIWGDCDPRTGLMVSYPKGNYYDACVVTDLGGMTPDLALLPKGIPIIQDAAQNFGGVMYGDAVCYSFQAIKQLTTGDGGCIIFRDKALADKARLQRWFGLDRTISADFRSAQNITMPGFKFHMTDIDAAIGLANMASVRSGIEMARINARFYQQVLPAEIKLPWQETATYWTYMILVERRKEFIDFMAEKGVHTSPVQSIGTKHDLFPKASLPGAEWYGARNVAIPNGWWVTDEERSYIADCVVAFEG